MFHLFGMIILILIQVIVVLCIGFDLADRIGAFMTTFGSFYIGWHFSAGNERFNQSNTPSPSERKVDDE